MKYKNSIILALLLCPATQSVQSAQQADLALVDNFLDLSLQQLMEIEIYTASQETETAAESASITSVITAEQLRHWGVLDLYEALSFLPGIVKNETYMGYSVLTFRGVTPGLFNNKALFMINGHPAYENLFGSSHLEYIPIEMVERIEVVRNPASVLYGTQAISGVVNVITKQGADNDNTATLRAGSNNHLYGSFTHFSENLNISGSMQNDDGYNFSGTYDEYGNPVDLEYKNDLNNLFLDYHREGWRINSAYFSLDEARYGFNPWVWQNGDNEHEAFYLDINKSISIHSGELNIWLRYNYMDKEMHPGEFFFPADLTACTNYGIPASLCTNTNPLNKTDNHVTVFNTVESYATELQYKDKLSDTTSYIVGANLEFYKTTPMDFIYDIDGTHHPIGGGFDDSHESETYALYGQIKYRVNENIETIAGLRTEKNSEAGYSGAVPRIGMTYKVKEGTYFKALYSEAFRTPIFLEKYIQVPNTLFGTENLERENIRTLELGIDSRINDNNSLQIALFELYLENEITRRLKTDTASTTDYEYYNASGRKMYGIEFDWKSIVNDQIEITLNGAFTKGTDETLEDLQPGFTGDAPFIASHTINAVVSYYINNQWCITFSDQFVSAKDYVLTDGTEGEVESYNLLNMVISYTQKNHEASLILRNLSDEDYTYPEPVRRNPAGTTGEATEIPGGPGTTGYVSYSYKF